MAGYDFTLTAAEWERFDSRLSWVDGCLVWTGPRHVFGYGHFEFYRGGRRRRVLAHRLAFFRANGRWARVTRHACDNPPCCNPEHLLAGTQADNMHDAVERGRNNTQGLVDYRESRDARVLERLQAGKKTCPHCREEKPLDAFHRSASNADGRQYWCAECRAERRRVKKRAA